MNNNGDILDPYGTPIVFFPTILPLIVKLKLLKSSLIMLSVFFFILVFSNICIIVAWSIYQKLFRGREIL